MGCSWLGPSIGMTRSGPQLVTLNGMRQPLLGQQPNSKPAEVMVGRLSTVPVGKVIDFSPGGLDTGQDFLNSLFWGSRVGSSSAFECSIFETESYLAVIGSFRFPFLQLVRLLASLSSFTAVIGLLMRNIVNPHPAVHDIISSIN